MNKVFNCIINGTEYEIVFSSGNVAERNVSIYVNGETARDDISFSPYLLGLTKDKFKIEDKTLYLWRTNDGVDVELDGMFLERKCRIPESRLFFPALVFIPISLIGFFFVKPNVVSILCAVLYASVIIEKSLSPFYCGKRAIQLLICAACAAIGVALTFVSASIFG